MKFLCLCHYDLAAFGRMTPDDFAELGAACQPHDEALRATGRVRLVGSLGMPHETLVVRRGADGAPAIGPGPYAESGHPVGAFFIVEADTVEEAAGLARLHPGPNLDPKFGDGGIEVFPVGHYETA